MLLDKPSGLTSNRSLQIVRHFFGAIKAGHTGTLDPMATGLLPICFGEATKFSTLLLHAEKTYHATLKLGYISTTGDAEGEISTVMHSESINKKLCTTQINQVLKAFTGQIKQIPPMYSALKYHGKPLYKYARDGKEVERKAREIVIYDLVLNSWTNSEMSIMVRCGMGTYIRTLAEDLGKALGFGGAYLTSLRRSQIGQFNLRQAYALDQFQGKRSPEHDKYLYSIDSLLHDFPALTLDEAETLALFQGKLVNSNHSLSSRMRVRLYNSSGLFLGVGETTETRAVVPKRLISQDYRRLYS